MMFICTPETIIGISFLEFKMAFEHFFSAVGFQHDFSGLNSVPFRYVNWKMYMTSRKPKIVELESKLFEFTKSFDASVDM